MRRKFNRGLFNQYFEYLNSWLVVRDGNKASVLSQSEGHEDRQVLKIPRADSVEKKQRKNVVRDECGRRWRSSELSHIQKVLDQLCYSMMTRVNNIVLYT